MQTNTAGTRGAPDAPTVLGDGPRKVPARALLLSVAALTVPLVAAPAAADLLDELEILIWLPALLPAFLLTYYRGWRGASLALAAAMATLTTVQVVISSVRAEPPDWQILGIVIAFLVVICLGIGWLGDALLRAQRTAEARALRDPLTGLPNRGHLRLFLDTAFGGAERGIGLVVVMFDLDQFKRVNDEHGHAAGDRTLVEFAEILRRFTRRSDLTARFGGEEFVSVLTGAGGVAGATIFASRVREALRAVDLPWGPVTVSAGIAAYESAMTSPDIVLAEADRALYRAKAAGRDRIVAAEAAGDGAIESSPATRAGDGGRSASAGSGEGEPAARDRKGARVLIVTDDEIVAEGLSRILGRAGFRTAAVGDGVEALVRIAGRAPPDVILSEVVMPRMGGLTLADRVREAHAGVRILLMSGYEHESLVRTLADPGLTFVKKPLTPEGLVAAVEAALRRPDAVASPALAVRAAPA